MKIEPQSSETKRTLQFRLASVRRKSGSTVLLDTIVKSLRFHLFTLGRAMKRGGAGNQRGGRKGSPNSPHRGGSTPSKSADVHNKSASTASDGQPEDIKRTFALSEHSSFSDESLSRVHARVLSLPPSLLLLLSFCFCSYHCIIIIPSFPILSASMSLISTLGSRQGGPALLVS